MSNNITNQNHPLIPNIQSYLLDRKLISFHSNDRDISQWSRASHFEIDLPTELSNIVSMRLVNISLPNNQYVFSNEYQNTKFNFSVGPSGETPQDLDVVIAEGSYTPIQLATEIENKMNFAVNAHTWTKITPSGEYLNFKCKYNEVSNTFWFGNNSAWEPGKSQSAVHGQFSLNFHKKMSYVINCDQVEVWKHYTKWGLPAYLGYEKKKYIADRTPPNPFLKDIHPYDASGDAFGFFYEIEDPNSSIDQGYWLPGLHTDPPPSPPKGEQNWYVDASKNCHLDVVGENWIYMEMDKYNTMDELEPYSENTAALYNNDYAGKVDSAFAKIPLQCNAFSQIYNTNRAFISNISHYNPPLKRINRLKFKFRYHDGRLVDFKCLPLTFVIEFNMLKNDIPRGMNVTVPPSYFYH